MNQTDNSTDNSLEGIAIVGLAGRFPGSDNIEEFWDNLINGVDSVTTYTDEECLRSGVPEYLLKNSGFIKRGGTLQGADLFDAAFFGYSPGEARLIDPQQRIFLECAWQAIENAGYDPEKYDGSIGIYAGCGINNYLLKNLISTSPQMESVVNPMVFFGNDKDFLTTRVSYKLNLTGPSICIQTACSTSLVAVQLASQGLLTYQCDMALAGAVSLQTPRMKGYLYTKGQILSSDGFCRAFDKDASGTIFGEGVGIVVLKRLEDALSDRDTIYAVIKGIAVNNDGAGKVGYTAPSVEGQATVIATAQAMAGISADDISYIEAHGTGTPLGDPIEISALTQAFRETTENTGYCAIGSIKPNIGHLDVAAGVAGLIKVALAVKNKKIPPSLYFREANPELKIDSSPFYVNNKLSEWTGNGKTRYAGISSFGIGGTNAHAVLSEPPSYDTYISSRAYSILLLSAKSEGALEKATENLSSHFKRYPEINLSDAAFTLQVGRRHFNHRRFIVCDQVASAVKFLDAPDTSQGYTGFADQTPREIVFMFTGQGSQYVNMGKELYERLPVFRKEIDLCADILKPILDVDLRAVLYPDESGMDNAKSLLNETSITQPALFTIAYGLAKFWMSCGIVPHAMVGHSIGEFVAACLAGVFSLNEALALVALRGRLMQKQERGSMLAVSLAEKQIRPLLCGNLCIAVINGPSQCVVSGSTKEIEKFQALLQEGIPENKTEIRTQKLKTSHAFHSIMMQPAVDPFMNAVREMKLQPPGIPFISNVTGTWITSDQATDPAYWANHLRQTVRFSDAIKTLMAAPGKIMLEIGPGNTLASLASLHFNANSDCISLSSIRHPKLHTSDFAFLMHALGQLWVKGLQVDWAGYYQTEQRRRIPLPGYPFEHKKYWVRAKNISVANDDADFDDEETETDKADVLKQNPKTPSALLDNVEARLAHIWEKALGIKNISKNADFYELGGHSLLAAQIFMEIETAFGKNIPLSTLFHSPTIATLAEVIKEDNTTSLWSSSLVPIRKNGSKRPLFLVHGAEGNVLLYRLLTQYLSNDQPVYGLQSGGLDGHEEFNPEFKHVAAKYIQEIKTVQPEGPYLLGGYCLGGTIALEMAQQLTAQGDNVIFLAMIEIYNIQSLNWPLPLHIRVGNSFMNVFYHVINLSSSDNNMKLAFFKEKARVELSRLKVSLSIWYTRLLKIFGLSTGISYHHLRVDEAYDQALTEYYPEKYSGKITLFGAKTLPFGFTDDQYYGFGEIAEKGVCLQIIPAYPRGTLVEPYIKILAEKIEQCIKQAELENLESPN